MPRFWREVDSRAGLSLEQAMLFYGDQHEAAIVSELTLCGYAEDPFYPFHEMTRDEQVDYNVNSMQLKRARMRLEHSLWCQLKDGAVYATGYASHSPLDIPATKIVADRWRILEPDFEHSAAKGVNYEISDILVFAASTATDPVPLKTFSHAKLREWYARWITSNERNGAMPSREEDLSAAQQALGRSIPRSAMRLLRKELAPESWKRFGRRPRS